MRHCESCVTGSATGFDDRPHLRRMSSMNTPTEQGSQLTMNALEEAASKPDVDPCDVACDAMPARVVGDLSDHDVSWLLEHTDDCNYCANELRSEERRVGKECRSGWWR